MLVALVDGEGSFTTPREAFDVDDDAPWTVPFYAYVAEVGHRTIAVDTGLGPSPPELVLPAWEGHLPQALAGEGLLPEQVDLVVLTHLHIDHVGWNMRNGVPFFPNARYVAHRYDYEWITSVDGDERYVQESVIALNEAGCLELLDHDAEPLPGVGVRHTGGHTPGHCIVELPEATLLGDLAVHELQLADPSLVYVGEEDPVAAAACRRQLFPEFASSGRVVGFGHLGLGRLVRMRAGFAWHPATRSGS